MIDYAVLCRAIEDWKTGQPMDLSSQTPPPRHASAPTEEAADGYEEAGDEAYEADTADAGEQTEDSDQAEDSEQAEAQAPEDHTMIYQMPEIIDEGETEGEVEEEEVN